MTPSCLFHAQRRRTQRHCAPSQRGRPQHHPPDREGFNETHPTKSNISLSLGVFASASPIASVTRTHVVTGCLSWLVEALEGGPGEGPLSALQLHHLGAGCVSGGLKHCTSPMCSELTDQSQGSGVRAHPITGLRVSRVAVGWQHLSCQVRSQVVSEALMLIYCRDANRFGGKYGGSME